MIYCIESSKPGYTKVIKTTVFISFALLIACLKSPVYSQNSTILKYTFTNEVATPENIHENLTASGLQISSGNLLFGNTHSSYWQNVPYAEGNSGWDENTNILSNGKYFYFNIDAAIQKKFSITGISFEYRATGSGPSAFTLLIDTLVIDTLDIPEDNTILYDTTFAVQDSTAIALQGLTSTQVKIIGWDNNSRSTSGGGDFRIDSVAVKGEVGNQPFVIDFDTDRKWTEGTSGLTSYATDHEYEDLGIVFTGGEALRNGTANQDNFPGALNEYSWRLKNNANVEWTATLNRKGTLYGFGLKIRRWDSSPSPDFDIEYSMDGGNSYTIVQTNDNLSLDNSSDWQLFKYEFNPAINVDSSDFKIRIKSNGTTERIMVDEFEYTFVSTDPEGLNITEANQLFTINFDDSLTGINQGQFQGYGFSPAPASGELDSKAWKIRGLDGAGSVFKDFKTKDAFAKEISTGGEISGGIYAFEVDSGNYAFGVQPTGDLFTPGDVILKILNNTDQTINEVSLAYSIYVYNDQNRSNKVHLSYSEDDVSYTDVSALTFYSTENTSSTPQWKKSKRYAGISGLTINDGDPFYLKWTLNDANGSGSRDEFALDDIALVAKPINKSPNLTGTFQNIAIEGEKEIQGDFIVEDTLILSNSILRTNNHKIVFDKGAVAQGHDINNFIEGNIQMIGNGICELPAGFTNGSEKHYGKVKIDNSSGNSTDKFTIKYAYNPPSDTSSFSSTMETVSKVEYWTINRDAGASNPDITLYWNDNDDGLSGINNPSNIVIAHWNNSNNEWENIGQDATNGNGNNGSVTVYDVSNFSDFTFGSTDETNDPLPVELLSFEGKAFDNYNLLKWKTASQASNDYFTVERSFDDDFFETLVIIDGAGHSNQILNYQVKDNQPEKEITYYRLKQTDFNGNYSYSNVIAVQRKNEKELSVKVHRDHQKVSILLDNLGNAPVKIDLFDIQGKRMIGKTIIPSDDQANIDFVSIALSGLFLLRVTQQDKVVSQKIFFDF
ncbi:MAG: T9SS type A sorting domain-containing protein [Bacteroidales bacterium]|nr:T9SS type A sorting domain-containing protein [Bacteroidales bacterium]